MNTTVPVRPTGLTLRANFSWTFIGNAINAAAWFLMTTVLAKLGTPEDVGQFALGLAMTAPIFMFATLRLRDVQATDTQGEYQFGDYFALRLSTTVMALLAVVGVVLISGFPRQVSLIILAHGVSKAIEAVSDAFYGLFMQRERLDLSAKSMIIKGPLSLLGLGIGFYLTGSVFWGVVGIIVARLLIMVTYDIRNASMSLEPALAASAASATLLTMGSAARAMPRAAASVVEAILPQMMPRPCWDLRTLRKLFWLTLPLGAYTMLVSFNSNIPRYFIEGQLGSHQLGLFAAIAAFQKVAPTVVQALGRSASPRLAKYYAASNVKGFRKLSLRLMGIGLLLGVGGMLAALVAGRQILTIFYGPEYVMPTVFMLVMVGAGIDYLATMLLFVITSARYFRVQLPLQILTTGTVALACFWLIPPYGLLGAAWALIVGNAVRVLGTLVAALHAERALARGIGGLTQNA